MSIKAVRARGLLTLPLIVLLGLAACDDDSIMVPESQLDFVSLGMGAPPLETMDTVFLAVPGEDRELEIRYENTAERFLRLRVDQETLLRLDGVIVTDPVAIRVTVDAELFRADFEPQGLEFLLEPAELEIRYDKAEPEFLDREEELEIWRQENPGDPWELVESLSLGDFRIEADIDGFTRYALAIGR